MADLKISQLPLATTPLAGTEVLPIVQSGTTKQATITNVLAGAASLGANTFTAAQDWATGTAITSAATVNLNTATGNRVHITGTTTITAVTLSRGPRTVIFDGVLTLTHNATTNNLPGGANITTAAGDRAIYESDGTTVYCVSYFRANGAPLVAAGALTLLSTVTASSSTTVDIETTFNSTYSSYLLIASGVRSDTSSGQIKMLMKLGGSYSTADYFYRLDKSRSSSTAEVIEVSGGSTVGFIRVTAGIGTNAKDAANFTMVISNPSSTTLAKTVYWEGVNYRTGSGELEVSSGVGSNSAATALTGLQFFLDPGLILSGTFSLYGYSR